MRFILIPFLVLGCIYSALAAEDLAVVVREATVYSKADRNSSKVSNLPAGTEVNIFGRQGGWKEIYSDKLQVIGWVRSFQVREGVTLDIPQTEKSADSRGFLSGLASLSRKASGFFNLDGGATSSGTATIGIRGLSEEEINTAQADFNELKKMKSFASSQKRQQTFSNEGNLQANKVEHIK